MRNSSDPALAAPTQKNAHSLPVLTPLLVIFGATLAAQLFALAFGRIDNGQSFASILLPSLLYISAVTLPLGWLGIVLGRRTGLGTPLLSALISRQPGSLNKLRKDAGPALIFGLIMGTVLLLVRSISAPYLPPELPVFGHRGVIGGLAVSIGAAVGEEVWFRLGLMTILIWTTTRITGGKSPSRVIIWVIILFTSTLFGAAHLPQLLSYGAGSPYAIAGTIAGNTAVGILYGWCYWRRGLLAAMVAHFSVDVVLHVLPAFFR